MDTATQIQILDKDACISHRPNTSGKDEKFLKHFANSLGDRGSISGWVIPKTQKMVLDTSLLSTQHYKVRFKGKVEQSRERSSALPYTSV